MGAMEAGRGDGEQETESKKAEGMLASTMHRAASVEDLFAPMWRLDVQASAEDSSEPDRIAAGCSVGTSLAGRGGRSLDLGKISEISAGDRRGASKGGENQVKADAWQGSKPPVDTQCTTGGGVSAQRINGEACGPLASLVSGMKRMVRETVLDSGAVKLMGSVSSNSSQWSSEIEAGDIKSVLISAEPEAVAASAKGNIPPGKASSHAGNEGNAQSNSTSDDDQLGGVDERKQKRMLSNRESARRSRLRKQQHLDELRAQVALLRAENNHMMTKFNMASQGYSQLTDENRVLRTHAMDLSLQLQRLHHTVATQHPACLSAIGVGSCPYGSLSHISLSQYSQPLVPDRLH